MTVIIGTLLLLHRSAVFHCDEKHSDRNSELLFWCFLQVTIRTVLFYSSDTESTMQNPSKLLHISLVSQMELMCQTIAEYQKRTSKIGKCQFVPVIEMN